jgi:hypothetical protein
MKKLSLAISVLTLFTFGGQAYSQLRVTDLKTTALDAKGKPELHVLLTGIRGPTKNLRVQTDTATLDFPWSWKASTADLWIAVGQWKILMFQVTYADGSHDSVIFRPLTKVEIKKK